MGPRVFVVHACGQRSRVTCNSRSRNPVNSSHSPATYGILPLEFRAGASESAKCSATNPAVAPRDCCPLERMQARSITEFNSRIFPGQLCRCSITTTIAGGFSNRRFNSCIWRRRRCSTSAGKPCSRSCKGGGLRVRGELAPESTADQDRSRTSSNSSRTRRISRSAWRTAMPMKRPRSASDRAASLRLSRSS